MPSIEENKSLWNDKYHWDDGGNEWSEKWGTPHIQWYGTILPRIRSFLPVNTILEIAPGYGRWTEYLKDYCDNLMIVDLSEKCIEACQERFSDNSHISYFVNDGNSLDMIPDDSVDFIFCYDSLVHAEETTISNYMTQLQKKLKQNGVAFIHHSNLGEYSRYIRILKRLDKKAPILLRYLLKWGVLESINRHWRGRSMSAKKMQQFAKENDLQCISQELVPWNTNRFAIDCMTTITKNDSIWFRENKVFKNMFFMKEANNLLNLSKIYDLQSWK